MSAATDPERVASATVSLGMQNSSNVVSLDGRKPDRLLVLSALDGDQGAKTELFSRHVDMAANTAHRLLGHDQEIEDVLQDSFHKAFSNLARLREPQAFAAWLRRIVIGVAIGTIRKRKLLRRLGLMTPVEPMAEQLVSPDAPPDVHAELTRVYAVLDALPTQEQVVAVLHFVEQRTLLDVAGETGWSHSTVKRALRRAKKKIYGEFAGREKQ